jgi:hypothetical protein
MTQFDALANVLFFCQNSNLFYGWLAIIESVQAFMLRVGQIDVLSCPHCGHGAMQVIEVIAPTKHRQLLATGPPP